MCVKSIKLVRREDPKREEDTGAKLRSVFWKKSAQVLKTSGYHQNLDYRSLEAQNIQRL